MRITSRTARRDEVQGFKFGARAGGEILGAYRRIDKPGPAVNAVIGSIPRPLPSPKRWTKNAKGKDRADLCMVSPS
jgi:hypothetical protein